MEERILGSFCRNPFLYIINKQEIHRLVETNEIIDVITPSRIHILYRKQTRTDIQHPHFRI